MSIVKLLLTHSIPLFATHPLLVFFLVVPTTLLLIRIIYRLSPLHPLASVPGPYLTRLSSLWLYYHAYKGDECTAVHALHQKYGPVVVTGPHTVDISDGAALHGIYVEKGGFPKAKFYENFALDGHQTIFSSTDPTYRAHRAKAVVPIFSMANLRRGDETLNKAVEAFANRLEREIGKAKISDVKQEKQFDLLDICRGLAIDSVTSYLFGKRYGGSAEDLHISDERKAVRHFGLSEICLSVTPMVDSVVAFGSYWYLPPWAIAIYVKILDTFFPNPRGYASEKVVDDFLNSVIDDVEASKGATQNGSEEKEEGGDVERSTYPGRLLAAGCTRSEVHSQCKDLIFAGTDSTAMNLASLCFHLIRNPAVYRKLCSELEEFGSKELSSMDDLQSIPYLRAVIREGTRMAMANPSRLPRIVPSSSVSTDSKNNDRKGWVFNKYHFPPGTEVGCSSFELHFNPETYPDPYDFKPERWLDSASLSASAKTSIEAKTATVTEQMNRDHITFGQGSRQCIARNLAMTELFKAVAIIARRDLLSPLKTVDEKIVLMEWFNSNVVGGKIEVEVAN